MAIIANQNERTKRNMARKTKRVQVISIPYYKKGGDWYVDYTLLPEVQNKLLAGAEILCEALADGAKRIKVGMMLSEKPIEVEEALIVLRKSWQSNFGAHYGVTEGKAMKGKKVPREIWIGNARRGVFYGVFSQYIYIANVETDNK